MNFFFDTGLLIFVADIHLLVLIHIVNGERFIAMGVDSRLSRHTRQRGLAITISSIATLRTCSSITYAVTGYREGHTRLLFYIRIKT